MTTILSGQAKRKMYALSLILLLALLIEIAIAQSDSESIGAISGAKQANERETTSNNFSKAAETILLRKRIQVERMLNKQCQGSMCYNPPKSKWNVIKL